MRVKMNLRSELDEHSRFEFLKYIGPAIVLFVIIIAFGPQLTEYGMKLIELDSDSESESEESESESEESDDDSLTKEIKRKTRKRSGKHK